ncbi:hypothetical protein FF011L_39170 [Roseimaritima multifibrata]|uniref:Uncharacterized protein n=1 Tax=Roseimaritima multifibrata TaxID=1930274 RepID=A0A517MJW3_9BACT|nr:hypothetical protein FF011L_39170 [Roseimaritima multifibrata]
MVGQTKVTERQSPEIARRPKIKPQPFSKRVVGSLFEKTFFRGGREIYK